MQSWDGLRFSINRKVELNTKYGSQLQIWCMFSVVFCLGQGTEHAHGCSITAVGIEMPHTAGVEFKRLLFSEGCEDGKPGCANGEMHLFHHLVTHTVSRMNFLRWIGSPQVGYLRGKVKGMISLQTEAI